MAITRHFLGWDKPALVSAVNYLISRFACGDQLDLSNVILVFPGRRAARRMLELLVQRAADRWPAMLPPRMVTFNGLPELLYAQRQQLADNLTQLLVWRKALYSVPMRELIAALPQRPAEDAVTGWMALCESFQRLHNELAADGLEFDEVFEKLSELGNFEEAERWKSLRRLQSEYLMQMDSLSLWDQQAARLIAVQQNECHTDCEILLIGTVDMNRTIRQMLAQVADHVVALVHAPESEADAFDEFGCVNPDRWESRVLDLPLHLTRITGSPVEQAHTAMRELAALDGRFRADDITIGVADENMLPALMQSLADAGVAGQWPIGMVMSESRPYRMLEALATHIASARDDLPPDFATLSDLVRHPDLNTWILSHLTESLSDDEAWAVKDFWLSALDDYVATHLQMTPGAMLGPAPQRTIVAEVCRAIEDLTRCLVPDATDADDAGSSVGRLHHEHAGRPGAMKTRQRTLDELSDVLERSLTSRLEKPRPLSEWAEGAVRVLATIYHDRELHSDSLADRGIVEFITHLQDLNEQLQRIPREVLPECSASQAVQLLLKQIAGQSIAPDQNDEAIELLGWLELPLDDSPVLIMTGFNEGFVPESINSDAFMPNSLRTRLNLTDNRRRYARDAYALTSILNSRRRVVLIKGRTDVKGNPLTPSRLWFAANVDSLPERVRWFYDPEYAVPVVLAETASYDPPEGSRDDSVVPLRLSGFAVPRPVNVPDTITEIKVTWFRDYLDCPYRYFLSRELKLSAVEDDVREMNAAVFGTLMHNVLSEFGESRLRGSQNPSEISSFLSQVLQKLSLARFGRTRSATVSVQLRMIESRLEAFAEWQAEQVKNGWRIVHSEQDFRCDDFSDIRGRRVPLVGRIDRIDRHSQTGAWRILDYKTSETAQRPNLTHQSKGEWKDLQLPLYRLLVKEKGIENDVELGYIQLPGNLSDIGDAIAQWTREELEDAERLAKEIAADMIDLKMVRVQLQEFHHSNPMSRLCQDSVIDRNIPWLAAWQGRHRESSSKHSAEFR
ncbi:MAG: PD-(D/E)XK nuclease family protein [Planctomycetota bacterium]